MKDVAYVLTFDDRTYVFHNSTIVAWQFWHNRKHVGSSAIKPRTTFNNMYGGYRQFLNNMLYIFSNIMAVVLFPVHLSADTKM